MEYGPCFWNVKVLNCLSVEWQKIDRRVLNWSSYYVKLRILTAIWNRKRNMYEFSHGNGQLMTAIFESPLFLERQTNFAILSFLISMRWPWRTRSMHKSCYAAEKNMLIFISSLRAHFAIPIRLMIVVTYCAWGCCYVRWLSAKRDIVIPNKIYICY